MQRNAIIFHGTGGNPDICWYPWLGRQLAERPNTEDEPVLQASYDWPAIKAHARDLYFVNSRKDPYGCDDGQGRVMFDRLGGTQIIRDDGHFGDYDQPYPTFELLDRLIA